MEKEIKQIMATIFEIDIKNITELSSPENIDSWDSIKHMNLILALEEEFNVEFSEEEMGELLNILLIKEVISSK